MKRTVATVLGAMLALVISAPASAQIQIPGFPINFPWFTNVPQAQTFEQFLASHPDDQRELAQNPGLLYDPNWRAQHRQLQYFLQTHPDVWEGLKSQSSSIYDTRFNEFLAGHSGVASDLRDDPELLYDGTYRSDHPELAQFLANHPRIWENLNAQHDAAGPAPGQLGAYDTQHRWHDANWWHQNSRDWFWEHVLPIHSGDPSNRYRLSPRAAKLCCAVLRFDEMLCAMATAAKALVGPYHQRQMTPHVTLSRRIQVYLEGSSFIPPPCFLWANEDTRLRTYSHEPRKSRFLS